MLYCAYLTSNIPIRVVLGVFFGLGGQLLINYIYV